MPRGVPRNKEQKTKDNVAKVNEAIVAEGMLDMLKQIMADFEKDLLKIIVSHPASDLEDIQRDYRASMKIAEKLRSKINSGTIARSQLKEEE